MQFLHAQHKYLTSSSTISHAHPLQVVMHLICIDSLKRNCLGVGMSGWNTEHAEHLTKYLLDDPYILQLLNCMPEFVLSRQA